MAYVRVRERGPGLSIPFVRLSGVPLKGSRSDSRRIHYADGRVRGRVGSGFELAAEALVRGLPLPQPPPFQGCVGELPSRCTTGVGERRRHDLLQRMWLGGE